MGKKNLMEVEMERLPPLNAIKAFEVAARAGSFTLAASELGVSSAAVSQQIRNLETWFGKQLFVRTGNRITLTDAGHAIYPQTARALGDIAAIGQRMLEGGLRTRLCRQRPVFSGRVLVGAETGRASRCLPAHGDRRARRG
ncbi:LysR family transcriptional regulator [Mesorhizobium sp. ES1-4]|uniref:LysR family transcriptional regulator n=1 Tax=Mesorhizobium sp. ES1-4 TaxID=2876627 RepID=UPI001CCF48E1|nr:LysR family transcriptional regulator [Mesorhizobium sp. ES1-4]MBZ9797452.1 LysR family transcriptional regulator [Mesorhizobium sp. ES1-4]